MIPATLFFTNLSEFVQNINVCFDYSNKETTQMHLGQQLKTIPMTHLLRLCLVTRLQHHTCFHISCSAANCTRRKIQLDDMVNNMTNTYTVDLKHLPSALMFTVLMLYTFTQVQSPIISLLTRDVCVGEGSGWRSRNVHLNETTLCGFSLRFAAST